MGSILDVLRIQNAKHYLMKAYNRLIVETEEGKEALIWMEIDERTEELLHTERGCFDERA
ncbi:MAG: hypothetical protein A4E74_01241 [Syntrophus sp. PtaB.Bin075]|nr:MAG: hypothetical protein A4E74_01241 [Syntrophus sp. PtaB.Bin075]